VLKEDIDIATRDNIAEYTMRNTASDNAFVKAGIVADKVG